MHVAHIIWLECLMAPIQHAKERKTLFIDDVLNVICHTLARVNEDVYNHELIKHALLAPVIFIFQGKLDVEGPLNTPHAETTLPLGTTIKDQGCMTLGGCRLPDTPLPGGSPPGSPGGFRPTGPLRISRGVLSPAHPPWGSTPWTPGK